MRTISKRSIYIMMSVFFFSTLMGCNPSETKENLVDPSPTEDNPIYQTSPSPSPSQTHPTRTPDLYRPDTVRETLAAEATQMAAQLTHTALPTATPLPTETPIPAGSFRLPPECEPFPDAVNILNDDLFARCGTEYPTLPWRLTSPAFFEDYTTRTGRLAYVDENRALWVYDFSTDSNQLWLGEEVIMAQWSPLSSSESGSQPLAILQADGELSLITGPSQISKIAIIGDASHLSWSPNGEAIAYIKDRVLYTVDSYGGQPRKIAEDVSGTPVWALEDQAIIVSATPFRIVKLDGSGTFTPTKPDGTLHTQRPAGTMVWWPDRRLLAYSDRPMEMDVTGRIWILELSDDLKTVMWHIFQNGEIWRIDGWWIPGESVIGWGVIFNVIPGPEEYMLEVEVEDLSLADYTIFAGWEWIYMQDDTQLLDRDGRQLSVTDLEQVSSTTLKVTCRPILQGCLASRIQILDK
jgi:hypothetical protein